MAKKIIKKKRSKFPLLLVMLVIIAASGIFTMFFAIPRADSVKALMEKDDFIILNDVNKDTPLLGALLPENANRQIWFRKTLNNKIFNVNIAYFDDYKLAKAYKDIEELNIDENKAIFVRGNAVIIGDKDSATTLRWKIWAF